MEFKLNKIDTDIRRKIEEKTKEDKVHGNDNIRVKKDISEEHNKGTTDEIKLNNDNLKRFITISAYKDGNKALVVEGEKLEELSEENSKGMTLDAKK